MKKIKNVQENLPIIFIAIAMLLLFINDLDLKEKDIYIEIKITSLFFIAFSIQLYQDLKSRKYSTAKLIIVVVIVQIVAFIALCYFNFKNIDKANTDLLWERAENIRHSGFIMILMSPIQTLLKSKQFEKNINL